MDPATLNNLPWAYLALATVLVVGASARLSRFVTSDKLGDWLILRPALRWAARHEGIKREATGSTEEGPISWQARAYEGLTCPFCVGFWIGSAVLSITAIVVLVPLPEIVGIVWHLGLAALALNYLVGHLSSRID